MNQDFGRQIKIYRYNAKSYIFLVILILIPIGISWAIISSNIDSDFTLIIFALLAFAVLAIATIIEWKYMKQRITVYEHGLRLQIHKQDVSVAITDIEDIKFKRDYIFWRSQGSPHFFFYVKLDDECSYQINLSHFETQSDRFVNDETIPDLPELVAFYDRWLKMKKANKTVKR